jgi:DNA-directed RNA polymerase specialized sigma24 family protein
MKNKAFSPEVRHFTPDQLKSLLFDQTVEGLSVLYDIYAASLYGLILHAVKDVPTAENILINTFIKARKEARSFENARFTMFVWLVGIAVQCCLQGKKAAEAALLKKELRAYFPRNHIFPAQLRLVIITPPVSRFAELAAAEIREKG